MVENKVLVIGGKSGSIGMELVRSLMHRGYEVTTLDRPETPENSADRETKRDNLKTLTNYTPAPEGEDLLDKQHAAWLEKTWNLSGPKAGGSAQAVSGVGEALSKGAKIIILAVGAGRKGTSANPREALIQSNTPAILNYGTQIAEAYLEQLKTDNRAELPFMVNVGNPADAMTNLLYRTIETILKSAMEQEQDASKAGKIIETLDNLPKRVLGMGGILDEARTAVAISSLESMKDNVVVRTPIYGPHNQLMVMDKEGWDIKNSQGERIAPKFTAEQMAEIDDKTLNGGLKVKGDTLAKTEIDQTAIFGAARGAEVLVQALSGEKAIETTVICHDPLTSVTMGQLAKVSSKGAEPQWNRYSEKVGRALYDPAIETLKDADTAARAAARVQTQTK